MASKPLRFHVQAEQEYLTALSWYRGRSPIAAINFESAFGEAVEKNQRSSAALADLLLGFPKIYSPAISLQPCVSGVFFWDRGLCGGSRAKAARILAGSGLRGTFRPSPNFRPRISPTIRGVPSEVVLNEEDGMKSPCAVNLHNAVTVSQQRLGRRVAYLSSARMNEVCAALQFSLGCDSG